jgi:hypothetical protein
VLERSLLPLALAALAALSACDSGSEEEAGPAERATPQRVRAQTPSSPLVERLRRGGYVLAFRHAATDFSMTDETG